MSVVSSAISKAAGGANTPTIYKLTLTNADTEYSQSFSANTLQLLFKSRTLAVIKYAWATGDVAAGDYVTLPAGCSREITGLKATGLTLFVESPTAGAVLEIEEWT